MSTPVLGSNHVDDTLQASSGTNFNGLQGDDTLVFDGFFADYSISLLNLANLMATITDGSGGVIDSKQIEYFKFLDGIYDVANEVFTPSIPTISVSDGSVVEGGLMRFVVSLSAPSTSDVIFQAGTVPGTALGFGQDFFGFPASGGPNPFTIPAGQTSIEVFVQTAHDTLDEPDETFSLQIFNVTGATIADGVGVGTIIDNDDPVTHVSFYADPNNIGEGNDLTFHFHRDVTTTALDVQYWMNTFPAGGATPGVDFSADNTTFTFVPADPGNPDFQLGQDHWTDPSMVVHFEPGQSDATLVLHTTADGETEGLEAFAVQFDFANNAPNVQFDLAASQQAYADAGGSDQTQVNIGHISDLLV
jgi:hypothetical protein